MEFGKAFTYVFEDKDWLKKIGIAALVSLIPLIGQLIVMGWSLEVTRRVIQNDPNPLPDWADFGGHTVRGLKSFVIGLVYALPIILLGACQGLIPVLGGDGADDTMSTIILVVTVCFSCVIFIYAILLALVLPAAYGKFAASDELGAAFRFREVFDLVRAAPSAYLIVVLATLVTGIVAGLGIILCFIGVFLTLAYAMAVNGHFYGQAYNQATAAKEMQTSASY